MVDRVDGGVTHARGAGRWEKTTTGEHSVRGDVPKAPRSTVAAIVLAGSYRRALDPVSRFLRDPLLPVAQLPVISYPLTWLRNHAAVRDIVICAHDATSPVRRYFGENTTLVRPRLQYYAEDHPRGPAGCARDAADLTVADTFVVVEGSLLPSLDLEELLRAHRESGAIATTVVEIERRRKAIAHPRLPGGIYVFQREALDLVAARGFQDIKQGLLERLHGAGATVHVHEIAGVSPRILDFATYSAASRWLVGTANRRPIRYPGFIPVDEGMHHNTAQISPRATFVGPVLVGADAVIGDDAVIVGPTCIGPGAQVHERATVARSVLLEDAVVEAGAYVDASLLAPGTRIEARAQVARLVRLPDETTNDATRLSRRAARNRQFGSGEQAPILARVASHGK